MLKSCKGFSLVEVIVAFHMLLIIAMFISPMTIKLIEGKRVLEQKRLAMGLLHDYVQEYTFDESFNTSMNVQHDFINYHLYLKSESSLSGELCVSWEGGKGDQNMYCTIGKR